MLAPGQSTLYNWLSIFPWTSKKFSGGEFFIKFTDIIGGDGGVFSQLFWFLSFLFFDGLKPSILVEGYWTTI